MRIKQDVIAMIQLLPDDCDYEDIMAEIYFKKKVTKGLQDIEQGRTLSHDEAKRRLDKWLS